MKRILLGAALFLSTIAVADYNVRMPSEATRPRWKGAKVGEWTMDYSAVREKAKAEGRPYLVFTTGSWWCPHCEAFEEKVLLANASKWNAYVQENGFYLVMLDFPYRGHVKDSEVYKSRYPGFGDGWGFQCWLYDDDYLAENGLSKEAGLNAIMDMYRVQQSLALPSATPVSILSWDGKEEFNYGKVGYPTLLVFLPDGTEAGRFSPGATNRTVDDAYNYVVEKIDAIMSDALDKDCGLCSEPEAWGLSGERAEIFRGWLRDDRGIVGTVEFKTTKKDRNRDIKISATATITGGNGKKTRKEKFSGIGHDCCIDTVTLFSKKNGASLKMMFSEDGMSGLYTDGDEALSVIGARDVFKANDALAKDRMSLLTPGNWSFVMSVTNAPSSYARGYGVFSVAVLKSGVAKFSGTLPDGKKVSFSGRAIIGDSDVYCVPVSINTYTGKRGGFGCVLWFKNGWLFNVTDIRGWESAGAREFLAGWRPIYTATQGVGDVAENLELEFAEIPEVINGNPVVSNPDFDAIMVFRNIWTGSEESGFRAKLSAKTGLLNGTMKFSLEKPDGRKIFKSCKVKGAVSDGTAYCSVLIGKDGSIPVKITSCGACGD